MLPITYQQLGDLRVLSNAAVGRQESHESGDCLAMDGQEQETTGKRKTKNSTSLVEGDRDLAKAKKESESMAKKDEKLRKKEEKARNDSDGSAPIGRFSTCCWAQAG